MCIKGPKSGWIAKSITPQLVVNQSKINPPTFRSFDFYNASYATILIFCFYPGFKFWWIKPCPSLSKVFCHNSLF